VRGCKGAFFFVSLALVIATIDAANRQSSDQQLACLATR